MREVHATIILLLASSSPVVAQADSSRMMGMAEHAMSGHADAIMMRHMELTPARKPTAADSAKALSVAAELRTAIAKYQDTAAAVVDGYKMFLPNVKKQHVYHFTNYGRAFLEAFRFNPEKPTSLLYKRDSATGKLRLIGAMYTAPKRTRASRLDGRIPLSIARWHQHVNWCVPHKGDESRWLEQKDGHPVFGPESPIATKAECDRVHGAFHSTLFGWMLHANVYAGNDLAAIFGDDHK
jgi:hypothetical protein